MQDKLAKLKQFQAENPFQFTQEQFDKIKEDITSPRKGVVYDEYVDFILWTKGLKSRQEYFADFIERILKPEKYHKLLDVGCGRTAGLSKLLAARGFEMTAMDPKVMTESVAAEGIDCIQGYFDYKTTDISGVDAIVAQEPCEATEHIVRACVAAKKNFVISLCGTAHRLINGEMPEDVSWWYGYLEGIGGEHCVLIDSKMVPGYVSYLLIGFCDKDVQ